MMFIKQAAISGFVLATLATAIPTPEVPAGLVVLEQVKTADGVLTWYGDASPAKRDVAPAKLDRRQCGSNKVVCSSGHEAGSSTCSQLIQQLSNNGGNGLPSSPRSICFSNSGGQCCVSWANPVSGANESDLVDAANAVLNTCSSGGRVSGLTRNTIIGTTCTTQCLSNRASGCK